jgi:predicted phage terminase large subunit-like protein
VIADDPIDPKKSTSEVELIRCREWWSKTISTRMTNSKTAFKVIVMQRLHEDDLTGVCLSQDGDMYEHINLPSEETPHITPVDCVANYTDGLLDGVRMDRDMLDRIKIDLGSTGYAGQMLQHPAPIEGNLIKHAWFRRFRMVDLVNNARDDGRDLVWTFVIDGAYTKDQTNDPTGVMAFCMFNNEMWIRDVQSVWLEMPELLKFIPDFVHQNGYTAQSRIYIEPKANGLSASQMLKRTTGLNVIIDKSPTTDKVARVNGVSPFIEAGRVNLLDGGTWVESFVHQCTTFPNAKHDDEVDCLTMAIDKQQHTKNRVSSFEIY